MTRKALQRKFRQIVAEALEVPISQVVMRARLDEDLSCSDTFDLVNLLVEIEQAFAVRVSDEEVAELQDLGQLKTLGQLFDLVANALPEGPAQPALAGSS